MESKIRIGIAGYGNLGKGVEAALQQNPDMELVALFSRRAPESIHTLTPDVSIYPMSKLIEKKNDIDVLILCGGSATDLPTQSPECVRHFNIVDSFDTHANIPDHFGKCDENAKQSGKIALISTGWDPGLFSLQRLLGHCVLPNGKDYTFWGKGVSQGHSDAIRRIAGVADAKQYTIPVPEAIESVRSGENPDLSIREKHKRECFVVAQDGADLSVIEAKIQNMPNYFADYDTTVHFISKEELEQEHSGMPHGGFVMRSGKTGISQLTNQMIEYSLSLGSNPEFTGSVLVCCARAAYRMHQMGMCGAKTLFDVAPAWLSPVSGEELRRTLL